MSQAAAMFHAQLRDAVRAAHTPDPTPAKPLAKAGRRGAPTARSFGFGCR
jgi:hypothetical protein